MSQYVSAAYHYGRDCLSSAAGQPLERAYHFLFPPLDDIFIDRPSSGTTMERRASDARRAALERGVVGGSGISASRSSAGLEDDQDLLDTWENFSDSPWSFVTSRYTMALIAVAIITNRIQHICRPRGRASSLSAEKRLALRIPSLLLLCRTVFIFSMIVADYFLSDSSNFNRLLRSVTTKNWRDAWLANKPMQGWALNHFGSSSRDAIIRARDASALWAGFTSTCVAVITDCLIRNLDADREEPPAFNLVGFAFLLHFHSFSPDAPANQHVYICVLLQLLHILAVSISKCRKKPMAPRLFISSFFGVASLLHYALTARSGQYPFMEAFSRTPEIALILVILLTVTLHALTMLLLDGHIEVDRLLFSRSNLPSLNEDWSIALFKVGTACMESTRLTGLEREVAPLVTFNEPYLQLKQSGRIEIVTPSRPNRTRRSSISGGLHDTSSYADSTNNGFDREIKEIRVESLDGQRMGGLSHFGFDRLRAGVTFLVTAFLLIRNLSMIGLRKLFRLLGLPDPAIPQWVYKGLRLIRLAWHGQNGEARRTERLVQRMEQESREQHRRRANLTSETQITTYQSRGRRPDTFSIRNPLLAIRSFVSGGREGANERSSSYRNGSDIPATIEIGDQASSAADALGSQSVDIQRDTNEEELDWDYNDSDSLSSEDLDQEDDDLERDHVLEVDKSEVSGLLEELESFVEEEDTDVDTERRVALRSGTEAFNQLLLAHLTRRSDGPPLTRSGYSSLLNLSPSTSRTNAVAQQRAQDLSADLHLAQTIVDRRSLLSASASSAATAMDRDEFRRLCVVCCVEERNVICWPCRCLCLCMDCREHLASRPPNRNVNNAANAAAGIGVGGAGPNAQNHAQRPPPDTSGPTHLCPTCRTPVQAFSRLYIP